MDFMWVIDLDAKHQDTSLVEFCVEPDDLEHLPLLHSYTLMHPDYKRVLLF